MFIINLCDITVSGLHVIDDNISLDCNTNVYNELNDSFYNVKTYKAACRAFRIVQ